MRLGSPTRLAMDVAAIESVAATTAPRTKPVRQSKPGKSKGPTPATPSTVNADQSDGEKRNVNQVVAKVVPGRTQGCGIKERGQDDEKNNVRFEFDLGHAGHKPDQQPRDDENDRIGSCEPLGQRRKRHNEEQQKKQNEFRAVKAGAWHDPSVIPRRYLRRTYG